MNDRIADVIVVGAGPAGSSAAFYLARAGVDVLLLDKSAFPRDKICGDSMAAGSEQVVTDMGLQSWIDESGFAPFQGFLLGSPSRETVFISRAAAGVSDRFPGYLVPRVELDQAMVSSAVQAGARLHEGVKAMRLERVDPSTVLVHALRGKDSARYRAKLVIAADGGRSTFTRKLGLLDRKGEAVAVRGYFEGAAGKPGVLEIHWEPKINPGYGWIFHMTGGTANVGIGTFASVAKARKYNFQKMLQLFIRENPSAREALDGATLRGAVRGHPLRMDADRARVLQPNVLVCGEAAGVVHPMTGEGIGPAMRCGRLAARHAERALDRGDFSGASLSSYEREFRSAHGGFHRAARAGRWFTGSRRLLDRQIRRARKDDKMAAMLGTVIAGEAHPASLFSPSVALRTLLG